MITIKPSFSNYVFIAFALAILYISFLVLKPFIIVIISSFVIAFIFYPLYERLYRKTKKENLSAFLVSLLIVLVITIPTLVIINAVSREVAGLYSDLTIKLSEEQELIGIECTSKNMVCSAVDAVNSNPKVRFYFSGIVTNLASSITRNTSTFLFSIPKKVIDLLIIFLLVFFLLKAGKSIWEKTRELAPLKASHKNKLLKRFSDTIHGVVYGYLIVALIEGFVGWAAFALVGSRMALVFGIIIGVMGLIPMIGAPIIWIPGSIIYFFGGSPFKAVILIAAGLIILLLDIFIRAKIIGEKTHIHPAIVALGVLGGVIGFGAVGVVIGPLVLSLLITSIDIYQEEKSSLRLD